ncbi:putative snRNA-activating protein complex subunit 1 [Apostichopus japonicus]|uniref:Putative snRNA-activating protein complex subunit 1 n=1 Tax=Stichopus japonicus TaxID=307972 RepID=A0A2G8L5R1_STIJA|nr:putative snRNA-activating protein complex subunit 1 [Apostichopus japonicus]
MHDLLRIRTNSTVNLNPGVPLILVKECYPYFIIPRLLGTQNCKSPFFYARQIKHSTCDLYFKISREGELSKESGLKIMEHKREFTEEAFRLAVAYLSPPFDFQQRTGGLYLMYAFYSTQRYQPKLKIRLSLQQWEHLKDIELEFKNQGHLDAAYILMKLKAAKAFIFAYSSKQFCFHKGYVEESSDKMVAEMQRDIEQAFPEDLLRKLHETHHKYQLLKSQLGISENLNHVTSSMAEVIAQRFQDIDGEEDKNGNSSKRSSRSERVAQLKAKSFSFMVDPEEQAASQPSSADDGENPSSSRSKSTVSGTSGRRRAKVPVDPDSRPLVDKLMPVLQKYNISESEDDGMYL